MKKSYIISGLMTFIFGVFLTCVAIWGPFSGTSPWPGLMGMAGVTCVILGVCFVADADK